MSVSFDRLFSEAKKQWNREQWRMYLVLMSWEHYWQQNSLFKSLLVIFFQWVFHFPFQGPDMFLSTLFLASSIAYCSSSSWNFLSSWKYFLRRRLKGQLQIAGASLEPNVQKKNTGQPKRKISVLKLCFRPLKMLKKESHKISWRQWEKKNKHHKLWIRTMTCFKPVLKILY